MMGMQMTDLYQGLLNILRVRTTRKSSKSGDNQGIKSIMLLMYL